MGFFHEYPYTDLHELNLDWIIAEIKKLHADWNEFRVINEIHFEGAWDISKGYKTWSVVNANGNGYISIRPTPAGIPIENENYWRLVANYSELFADLQNRVVALENAIEPLKNGTFFEVNEGDDLQSALDTHRFLWIKGTYVSDIPYFVTHPITIIFDHCEIHQTVWGNPAIVITTSNVDFMGDLTLINDVTNRTPITHGWYDFADAKANSTGIMLYNEGVFRQYENLHIECLKVYNFIGGICNITNDYKNINIDYIYVENVDFGVFGAHYVDTNIGTVEFKDIASYLGSIDPSHAVYLTGDGATFGLSKNVTIGRVVGDGCRSKNTDAVISVKSTENFHLESANVKNISQFMTSITSTGYAKDVYADTLIYFAGSQLTGTDFTYKNCVCTNINAVSQIISNSGGSIMRVENCKFNIATIGTDCTRFVYCSSGKYYEKDCEYISAVRSESVSVYYWNGDTNDAIIVYNPTIKNVKTWTTNSSIGNRAFTINADNLDYPITNQILPNRVFLPSRTVYDESDYGDYPNGFRTCPILRVTNANVQYFNTDNATNGTVYTLINGGNSRITAGSRIKTKTGASYDTTAWLVFRFINIGNVAVEV